VKGRYTRVRHPACAGPRLTLVGLGVVPGHWVGLLGTALGLSLASQRRMAYEEEALVAALGQECGDYLAHTKRLVPRV
jgi:protein-S-isoprenylcysteine O-methyltransferase Ste14